MSRWARPERAALTLGLGLGGRGSPADPDAGTSTDRSSVAVPSIDARVPCPALVGDDGLVDLALRGADLAAVERSRIQDALFEIVLAGPPELQDPSGQMVDYLDDPPAYQPLDGAPDDVVTAASEGIRTVCS